MGNCIRHESSMKWAGEDWGFLANDTEIMKKKKKQKNNEDGLQGDFHEDVRENDFADNSFSGTKIGAAATEVKVKITKKQLEELLGRVELKQMSIQQVLAQLITVGTDRYETQQRSWRPALQSISEVN